MKLTVHPEHYAICRLHPDDPLPIWVRGNFISMTRTPKELSIVCPQHYVPKDIQHEGPWRILEVEGPLAFSMVGVLATLTQTLAQADLSLFTISTFDTDYLLVKEEKLELAKKALLQDGHFIQ
jgi:uncharacterized protein